MDVRFTLKDSKRKSRNHALSNSKAMIAFESHFLSIYRTLAAVTSITLKNEDWFSKTVFQQHMVTYGYPLYGLCVGIVEETFCI